MESLIVNSIAKTVTSIPGVLGLASLDFREDEKPLKENDFIKAISLEGENDKNASIAVIVSHDIAAKIVVKEITKSITNIFKRAETKLGNVQIYIRGVK